MSTKIPDSVYAHSAILEKHRGLIRDLEATVEAQERTIAHLVNAAFPDGLPDDLELEEDPQVPDLFDPTKHNVAEVTAYLNEVAKDPTDENKAEIERVLAAERAGEHRKSLVGERTA